MDKEFETIHNVLQNVSSKQSVEFINRNYGVISLFAAAYLDNLQALRGTPEGCIALAKIYFSLQRYDEAIDCLRGVKLEDDGAFFYRRMTFIIMDRYLPPDEMNEDALGYLFEKERYDEIKKFEDFGLINKLAKKERSFYNWVLENHDVWMGNSLDVLYLRVDALAKKKDVGKLSEMINTHSYPTNYILSYYLFDNYPFISRDIKGNELLCGRLQKQVFLDFLAKNNKTDFNFLNNLGRYNNKFDSRIITLLSNSIMNMGTTNDSLYRLNTDLLSNSKPWNRFIGTSALGNIHIGNENPYEILQKYLPNESDLKRGGSLLALGFINKIECKDEDIQFFNAFLTDKNLSGEIQYGAALGLGLVAMGSVNLNILNMHVKSIQSRSELIVREGLLVSMGMVCAGQARQEFFSSSNGHEAHDDAKKYLNSDSKVENDGGVEKEIKANSLEEMIVICETILLEICKESEHEREGRCAGIGLALSVIGTERALWDLLRDKNEVVRYSGALVLGASFVGTGNLEVISRLLDLTNDGDDNVKRATVFGIGLICCADPLLLLNILKPLATNHSPSIRATVALALGFFLSGTANQEASNIIEALLYDSYNLVVQQAGLGLGLLLMQCNSHINANFKRMTEKLNNLTTERAEDCSFKFGTVLGRALMEAGGTNIVISVLNSTSRVETSRVVGAILFFQYWFWYPFFPFLSLCMKPTAFFAFDESLKPAKCEILIKEKKSKFDYECIKIEEPKRQRRFKRKEQHQPKEVAAAVDEPESYVIRSGDRMTTHEMRACNRENHGFVFLTK
jgi:26S proteasome regulatory subunit N2